VAVSCIRDLKSGRSARPHDDRSLDMELAVPRPTLAPSSHPPAGSTALPCPCGRPRSLAECCLPVAHRLRATGGQPPSPFDEIRAASALLLWSLLAAPGRATPATRSLSRAARRFWGPLLARALGHAACFMPAATPSPAPRPRNGRVGAHDLSGCLVRPRSPAYCPRPGAAAGGQAPQALQLFERTWGSVDPETRSWLLATLPPFARPDPLLAELSLDWLLWDAPWLRGRPGAHWTMRASALRRRPRVRDTYEAILRSRPGLWRLEEHLPQRGFRLVDRLTGDRTLLHTGSDPWPDAGERLLLARIYAFGDWRLLGGRCLLLDPMSVDRLLTALRTRADVLSAPPPRDPRWRAWLKAELVPLVAAEWLSSRLAPPPPDRYHGTYC
jgi:hypothetical protein